MAARPSYASLAFVLESTDYQYPEPAAPRGYDSRVPTMASQADEDVINARNHDAIKYQIDLINKQLPFFPSKQLVRSVVTDMDHFPYTRFFRGNPAGDTPIIMEREAGYRRRLDCYEPVYVPDQGPFPSVCFEGPCSTTYPCNPAYLKKYSDAEKINLMLNKACVSKMP